MADLVYRPIPSIDPARPPGARDLAGGLAWYNTAEELCHSAPPRVISADAVPMVWRSAWEAPRPNVAALDLSKPRIMGILNATPDSFSDGGTHTGQELQAALAIAETADILDIGGESTRPGAAEVGIDEEIARVVPVIAGLRAAGVTTPISIDTRKAAVATAALKVGANIVNDVSGLAFDPAMAAVVAAADCPVVLMHMRGTPQTMTSQTDYADVVFDVFASLRQTVAQAEAAGIARSNIIVDPGIGFAKTAEQNLALLQRLSIFHGLGCPILLGASRKRFIGTYTGADAPQDRLPGSLAVLNKALTQGVQIVRVHDTKPSMQAMQMTVAELTAHRGT